MAKEIIDYATDLAGCPFKHNWIFYEADYQMVHLVEFEKHLVASPEHFFQFNFDDWYPVIGKALLLKHDVMTDAWSDVPVTIEQLNEVVEFSRRKVHGSRRRTSPAVLA